MEKISLGNKGEEFAAKYLSGKGFAVLFRNFRLPDGEIDIIARAPNGILVFVEVKTMAPNVDGLLPEDQMTRAKRKKMERAAQRFVGTHPGLIDEQRGWRIDAVAIVMENKPIIRHYENL